MRRSTWASPSQSLSSLLRAEPTKEPERERAGERLKSRSETGEDGGGEEEPLDGISSGGWSAAGTVDIVNIKGVL